VKFIFDVFIIATVVAVVVKCLCEAWYMHNLLYHVDWCMLQKQENVDMQTLDSSVADVPLEVEVLRYYKASIR